MGESGQRDGSVIRRARERFHVLVAVVLAVLVVGSLPIEPNAGSSVVHAAAG